MPGVAIRAMQAADWPSVRAIYLEGIATGNATFAESAPEWREWDAGHLARCRLVAQSEDEVVGWASLSPYSGRCVYGGVAEVSIYVAPSARGTGIGGVLLKALIEASEEAGFWTLQAGIFPENTASIHLHTRRGFRVVGTRERLGCMKGIWRDVVLMERRSELVGAG